MHTCHLSVDAWCPVLDDAMHRLRQSTRRLTTDMTASAYNHDLKHPRGDDECFYPSHLAASFAMRLVLCDMTRQCASQVMRLNHHKKSLP